MRYKLFLFYVLFWLTGRLYLYADTFESAQYLHSVGLHVDLAFIIGYIVYSTPYSRIKRKIFWGYFFLYEILSLAFYIRLHSNISFEERICEFVAREKSIAWSNSSLLGVTQDIFIPLFIIFVGYQLYRVFSRFDISNSDKVNFNNIFIIFRYPKNIIGLSLCLFTPIKGNSISLYANGHEYCFKKRHLKLIKIKRKKSHFKAEKYFLIDTKIPFYEKISELENLIGKSWLVNQNCLTEFQSVIGPLKPYLR
ncbi:MAG: hypothetical protein GY941_23670 [Planctomycetes bacterium]|nr:hypothetical protein [Planctomycetota bacterium]